MLMRFLLGLFAALLLNTTFALADNAETDWRRFRGPNGTGIAGEGANPPITFGTDENLKWKIELPGAGVSCPIVVGDRVFVTSYSGYGVDRRDVGEMDDLKRHLVCVNRHNGEIVWQKTIDAVLPEDRFSGMGVPEHGYASHTPVSDGEHVYCFFGKTGALAFDMQGNELWRTGLGTDSDPKRWGSSSSPILYENVLIVPAGAESRAIVGLDKQTGKELWRAKANSLGDVWGTPAIAKVGDDRTDLIIGAPYEIWGLNPETGKLRWYNTNMAGADSFSSSVVVDNGIAYAIEGRSGGSIATRIGGKGDITESNTLWSGRDRSRFGTPLVLNNRLYFFSSGIVSCLDAKTGDEIFQARLESSQSDGQGGSRFGRGRGGDYASPVAANGRIYYVRRNGDIFVLNASDEYELLAVNRLTDDSEDFSATPAISGDDIFFRSNRHLYAVGE